MRIIYIDIDTLNPSHLGCYGYNRNTSPNIDSVAKKGVRFENYYCSNAPCLPSRAALVSGMFGIHNGCVGHGNEAAEKKVNFKERGFRNPDDENNLFNVFRKCGMHTTSISTFAERHSAWWFNSGFHEMYNNGTCGQESGEEVEPLAIDWLKRNKDRDNWFLHFHLWDPHTSIRVPESYPNPFKDEELDPWYTQELLDKHMNCVGPHSCREISGLNDIQDPQHPRQKPKATTMKELKEVIDSYDTGISYADYIVGHILDLLKEQGIYEETAIIISSDHGENVGELGIYQEHGSADQATCHIPLIFKLPEGAENVVAKNLYYNVDLAPTMADLLGVEPYHKWDGESYSNVLKTGEETEGREFIVVSQMSHIAQRAVRYKDWIYIRSYHDGFHLFDDEMLFDLKNDPHEEFDIKDSNPDVIEKCRALLGKWTEDQLATSDFREDPLRTVMHEGGPFHARNCDLPPYLDRLRKTGRASQADELEKKFLVKNINREYV
jgi:arylsulfatase A-like enzyme